MKKILIGMLIILLLILGVVRPAVITVGKDGSGYKIINEAIDFASAGDTILVQAGTYRENVNVYKPLVLRGLNWPIIDAGGEYPLGPAITVLADGVVVEGFQTINSTNTAGDPIAGAGIWIAANSSIIKNNLVRENYRTGIMLHHGSNNTIVENNVTGNSDGIAILYGENNTVSNNLVINNQGDGIALGLGSQCSRNNCLVNNSILGSHVGISGLCSIDDQIVGNEVRDSTN